VTSPVVTTPSRPRRCALTGFALLAMAASGLSTAPGASAGEPRVVPAVQPIDDPVPSPSATPSPAPPPASFPVVGAGYGHGVGMSQWGAYGMAQQGFDAAAIVTHYYSGTTVTPVQDDQDIRVNLLYQVSSARVRAEALDPSGGAVEVTLGNGVVVAGPADEFRFGVSGSAVAVQRFTGGQATDLGTSGSVTVRWAGTRTPGSAPGGPTLLDVVGPSSSLESSGHRYRFGYVEILPVSTSAGVRLNVVNAVRIHEEYLYGISEVSSSWPKAALQAQILAARSYALSKVNRGVRSPCGCHVDDGGGPYSDQTFTGWTKATAAKGDNWLEAVNGTLASDTTGQAILFGGQPISAFYSASSGGTTRSSQEAWGGNLPYAVSVPDPYIQTDANPYKSWTVDASQGQMARIFGLGTVAKVEITDRYPSGAVRTVTATGVDGATSARSGTQFQNALGLRSSYVLTISGAGGPALPGAAPAPETAPAGAAGPVPAAAPAPAPAPTTAVRQRTVSLLTPTVMTRKVGHRYKVVGVVRPAKARLAAWRQVYYKNAWVTVQKARTSSKGRYVFVIREARFAGSTRTFRVLIIKKGIVVGVSPQFTVAVRR
jgi:SpoIID/LytB domain protein